MRRRTYKPEYPNTLLGEALDLYLAEVMRDKEAQGRFVEHIQPLVRHCVGRVTSQYSNRVARNAEDIVGYVNLQLIRFWVPKYLASKRKKERKREAVKYFSMAVRGYTYNYLRETYDPRTVPVADVDAVRRSITDRVADRVDREEVEAAVDRATREHLALRRRPEAVAAVVRKLMEYLVWEEYRSTGEVPR